MRIAYFDNIKVVLIFFVILGHLMGQFLYKSEVFDAVYIIIYLFHMPLFIFISGNFAKGFKKKGYIKTLAIKLLIPYLLFQLIYTFYYNLFGDGLAYNVLIPRWALWFLLSLFCWNLMLYLFTRLKYGLVVSIAIGVLIGYVSEISSILSLSRTFFFFPFFLLGYYIKEEQILFFKKKKYMILSVLFVMSMMYIAHAYTLIDFKSWIIGKRSYMEIVENTYDYAWLLRLSVYVVMFLVSLAVMVLIPKRELFVSKIGRNTIYIYLLHLFFVKIIIESPIKDFIITHSLYWLLILLTVLIFFCTQSRVVRAATGCLVEISLVKKK